MCGKPDPTPYTSVYTVLKHTHTHTLRSFACCLSLRPCQLCAVTSTGKYPHYVTTTPSHTPSQHGCPYNHPPHTHTHTHTQHGCPVDAVDGNGHSALFRSCERGHSQVVVVLCDAGASVQLADESGRVALHWAASGGHAVICSSLLHQGVPADSTDNGGYVLH